MFLFDDDIIAEGNCNRSIHLIVVMLPRNQKMANRIKLDIFLRVVTPCGSVVPSTFRSLSGTQRAALTLIVNAWFASLWVVKAIVSMIRVLYLPDLVNCGP